MNHRAVLDISLRKLATLSFHVSFLPLPLAASNLHLRDRRPLSVLLYSARACLPEFRKTASRKETLSYMEAENDDGEHRTATSSSLEICEIENNQEPYEGMLFESEEAARAFYDDYARRVGFLTRVLSSRKSERDNSIISRGLGCRGVSQSQKKVQSQKQDRRKSSCMAMILLKREKLGRWVVRKFVKDHDHAFEGRMQKGPRTLDEKDKKIQELTAELRVKKRLSAAYQEQLLVFMKDIEDHNMHLSTRVQIVCDNLKELEAIRQEQELLHPK